MSKPTTKKDKRVAFDVPPEIAPDYAAIAKQLKVSAAGLGSMSARFVIPLLKSRKLVCLNGEFVAADQVGESLKSQAA